MSYLEAPQCPKGHGQMILRTSHSNNNPGRMYYICPLELKHEGFFVWWDVYQRCGGRPFSGDACSANYSTTNSKKQGVRSNLEDDNVSSKCPCPSVERTDHIHIPGTSAATPLVNQNWEMDRGRFLIPVVHVYVVSYVVVLLVGVLLGVLIARVI